MNSEAVLVHYAVCALWSSTDAEGNPLDDKYDIQDIAPETFTQMREEVKDFLAQNQRFLAAAGMSEAQTGHDFWLTRNGHGAGFWDRDLGMLGDRLTHAAKLFSSADLYVGDDFKIYQA